ncbi:amidohydrolase family protein [Pedobacter sp. L105]|uniref:amidohydrolase family protein n=1 Tax=Pedobacter sp. L105 TaxID=1641871 RepID=UPI00131E93B2|nr:amidohydrolase family protein [Pedobacter sp. L105]
MRIVTLEEHLTFPELTALIPKEAMAVHTIDQSPMIKVVAPKLADITGERLSSMDASGITVQVLSVAGPGADLLSKEEGPAFAKQYNDTIAERIAVHPNRFTAFAHLPMTAPEAAADELERTVNAYQFQGALINGMTDGEFLDHPKFAPVLQRAERLGVPIYLHPGLPPKAVVEAYYEGLPKHAGQLLSIAGWGWHSETAVHLLRLIVSGTLDRYPKLKVIIGHMGEMLPMMIGRLDDKFKVAQTGVNERYISETLKQQVFITTSGIFTLPPLNAAIDTFGIDNIMFSVDYPFSTNEEGKAFLDSIPLQEDQVEKIAHGNADRLLSLNF